MKDQAAKAKEAAEKLHELLHCGNERVELAAAKELLSLIEKEKSDEVPAGLDVRIKVVK